MTLVRSGAVVVAAAAVVAALVLGGSEPRPIVLVSGRDDHGLLARETVPMLDGPEGEVVGQVPDGTVVAVDGSDGEWLRVTILSGSTQQGWINDFFLRGTAHVVGDPPACPVAGRGENGVVAALPASLLVRLVDVHEGADGLLLGVEAVEGGTVALVPGDHVQELPGPAPRPGVDCASIRIDPRAVAHRH